ncbi:hypothetical protein Q428_11330 [Fervidicella metallireducens AeB]|uniref:DUF4364 domain-containing protein n=1 Tax=Fervidicella metallireducens AeB TaxID=1403537 RepID=A0A017RV44_9CLOT|nr:DUF4364 family protein [Fervidicella metallireducens]EYE87785.1 hypothetical protein Q428_11330 [Fervidicella metallireducens AeB]
MFNNYTELAENKLLLLYILKKIDSPITNSYLTQIVLENNLINYFSLQQYLSELIESGFVNSIKENSRHTLKLSQRGRDALELFVNRIPDKRIKIVNEYLDKNIPQAEKGIEAVSEYIKCPNNKFLSILKLQDKDEVLFELRLTSDSNVKAREICERWKKDSEKLYENIINLFKE